MFQAGAGGGSCAGIKFAQRVAQRISLESAGLNQTPVLLISRWVTVDK